MIDQIQIQICLVFEIILLAPIWQLSLIFKPLHIILKDRSLFPNVWMEYIFMNRAC